MKTLLILVAMIHLMTQQLTGQEITRDTDDSIYLENPGKTKRSSEDAPLIRLYQNYPNPVQHTTQINFKLTTDGFVSLEVYDLLGNYISSVVSQHMRAGFYSIPLEVEGISNGIYFYKLKKGGDEKSMKMTVQK